MFLWQFWMTTLWIHRAKPIQKRQTTTKNDVTTPPVVSTALGGLQGDRGTSAGDLGEAGRLSVVEAILSELTWWLVAPSKRRRNQKGEDM